MKRSPRIDDNAARLERGNTLTDNTLVLPPGWRTREIFATRQKRSSARSPGSSQYRSPGPACWCVQRKLEVCDPFQRKRGETHRGANEPIERRWPAASSHSPSCLSRARIDTFAVGCTVAKQPDATLSATMA